MKKQSTKYATINGIKKRLKRIIRSPSIVLIIGLLVLITITARYSKSTTFSLRSRLSIIKSKTSPTSTPTRPLFFDALNGPNRIVTNEFVHWSKGACPYTSSNWDMTSGTLMIKNGAGYSGIPTAEKSSYCESEIHNNSAVFRLNTKENNFGNVTVSVDYMAVQHGGGGAPNNSYDGMHIWLGYQSEYALYAATIYRWDGTIVLKKKVPEETAQCDDPSNDGCYYNLSDAANRRSLTTPGVWHHAEVTTEALSNKSQHITVTIDNTKVIDAVDNSVHGSTYPVGAVGVRGDNTEFYFKNFMVNSLD